VFVAVKGDDTTESAIAKHFGVDATNLLNAWKWLWGQKPLVIFDIHSKDDFRAATFRAEVKRLVTSSDAGMIRCLIIASDGVLFQQLTHEPRLSTFVARELSIDLAIEFMRQQAQSAVVWNSSDPSLRTTPRTLQNLIWLSRLSPSKLPQSIEHGISSAMETIDGAFNTCDHAKDLLQLVVTKGKLLWSDVERLCGNKYNDQFKFNQDVVKRFNLFFPIGTHSYHPQFDQTVEAMKRILEIWK